MGSNATSAWQLPAAEKIGADQLSTVIRATPAATICGLVNASIVTASFWSAVPHAVLFGWLALTATITLGIYLRRSQPRWGLAGLSRRALRRATLMAVLSALPWAVLPALYL